MNLLLFIWFIPLIIAAASAASAAVVFIVATVITIWDSSDKKDLGMAVLGMQQSGKTLWYNYLMNTTRGGQTTQDEYKSFKINFSNGRTVTIRKGTDIGGMKSNEILYEKMVKDNDLILFFFNMNEYLNDSNYKRDVNSRLDLVNGVIGDKPIILVLSYSDKCHDSDNSAREIIEAISERGYKKLTKYVYPINMINKKEIEILKEKIFKEKD